MIVWQPLAYLAFLLPLVSGKDQPVRERTNVTVEKSVQVKTHSIYAPYIDQDLQNRWWDFGADAYINTNKHIRLTQARPSQMGWLWSRLPITSQNFIIEVEFKITSESGHLAGDGLALWLTTTRAQPGPVFGSIDKFEGLGVFLDSYANTKHSYSFPRVVAMLGDGNTAYDHAKDGDPNSVGACSASYRRATVPTKLRLTYAKGHYLEVKLQYKSWEEWTDCFRIEPIELPQTLYLGLTALTGDVYDEHNVIAVSTYSALLDNNNVHKDMKPGKLRSSSGKSSSWFSSPVKLLLFAGLCVGLFYGYRTYSSRGAGSAGRRGGALGGNIFSSSSRF